MDASAYIQRNPRQSPHFQLVEDYFEELERVWDERYASKYGYWRGHATKVIWSYLDCGDPRHGFARIRCTDCGHELIVPFSCKRRHFCPSCHERRTLEFGEFCVTEIASAVPHRQWVFSIPKMLRVWFMFERKLLGKLCSIAWRLLSKFMVASTERATVLNARTASVASIQTFGESVNFNPHIHIVAADGCFLDDGAFSEAWAYDTKALEDAFSDAVFLLLQEKGLSFGRVEMMRSWHHSGFHVHRSAQIPAKDTAGLERLFRYIVRCPFALSKMAYDRESATVSYLGKTTGETKSYQAIDFLARLVAQIPDPHFQTVRYYGFYSSKTR